MFVADTTPGGAAVRVVPELAPPRAFVTMDRPDIGTSRQTPTIPTWTGDTARAVTIAVTVASGIVIRHIFNFLRFVVLVGGSVAVGDGMEGWGVIPADEGITKPGIPSGTVSFLVDGPLRGGYRVVSGTSFRPLGRGDTD